MPLTVVPPPPASAAACAASADTRPIQLAPGVQVIRRGDTAVQFGLDATRAGVLEVPSAPAVAGALMRLRSPTPLDAARRFLRGAGLREAAARGLLDDLLSYGVLRSATPLSVILLGRTALARATRTVLTEAGVTVRAPLRGESEPAYLRAAPADVPVLLVDRLPYARSLAPVLAQGTATWLSGAVIDSRGMVGPLRLTGVGPCPLCVDLHRCEVDRKWASIVTRQTAQPAAPDQAAVAATAAVLATVALKVLGVADPPGAHRPAPQPGAVTEVDPYGATRRYRMRPHRRCPVCFTYGAPGERKFSSTASSPAP